MSLTQPASVPSATRPSLLDRTCRNLLRRRLAGIGHGVIELEDDGGIERFGRTTAACPLTARLRVLDTRFYRGAVLGGSVGGGRAYVDGYWQADDLPRLLRILAINIGTWNDTERWQERLLRPVSAALRYLRDNSLAGSRRNIAAHYDLGNELFALFLDRDLQYSSAVFEHPGMSLEDAQRAKLDLICRKLGLKPGDHLLEIGTGWGGLALHAAREYGCRVTTTTISREQHALASQRVQDAGLGERITLLCQDYRRLTGQYDKLVSVEMIEAVGHRRHAEFFSRCNRLLKPDGLMLLQAITIAEQRHDAAARQQDFIQRHVFPGGSLPSVSRLAKLAKHRTDMQVSHVEDLAPHYALTLRHWRQRFLAQLPQVRALGYPPRFLRLWEFYLAYCEAGFAERATGVVQMVLGKPMARPGLAV